MTTISHPADALAMVRKEFPTATMELMKDSGGRLYGYTYRVGRSKHFATLDGWGSGGVDYGSLRLWFDGLVYARNKRAA